MIKLAVGGGYDCRGAGNQVHELKDLVDHLRPIDEAGDFHLAAAALTFDNIHKKDEGVRHDRCIRHISLWRQFQ